MATAPSAALFGVAATQGAPPGHPVAVSAPAFDVNGKLPSGVAVPVRPADATPAALEASYYGDEFAGRPTASGEIFNPALLTAAHRTLPFNSLVRVTDAATGKSVVVRINDRGPFHGNREIDLSTAAAREIGMLGTGTAKVNLGVVRLA